MMVRSLEMDGTGGSVSVALLEEEDEIATTLSENEKVRCCCQ